MIKTGSFDPITEEFGLPKHATNYQKSEAVIMRASKTFAATSFSSFAAYNFIFLFDDIKNGAPINFRQNAKISAIIGAKIAAEQSITCLVSDSIGMCRGYRQFYDPIIGGAVAGAALEVPNGFKAMGHGAFNGAMMQSTFVALNYAIEKLAESTKSDD